MHAVKFLGNVRLTKLYEDTVLRIKNAEMEFDDLLLAKNEAHKLYSEVNCKAISETVQVRNKLLSEFSSFKESIEKFSTLELSWSIKKALVNDVHYLVSERIREMKHLRSNIDRIVTADLK